MNTPSMPLWRALAALLLAWLWLLPGQAQTAGTQRQPVPQLTGRVIDQTRTLDAAEQQQLSQQLKALEDSTGAQVVVLMVPTTAPEDIAAYANRVAQDWKIGRRDIGDGLLVIVAKDDRRMRLEVARRLEGAIPDIKAAQIIDQAMKPRFRQNDYAGGLSAAVEQLSMLIRGEQLPAPAPRQSAPARPGSIGDYAGFLLPVLFFGFPLAIALARSLFGRGLGSLIVGGLAGGAAFLVTSSLLIAGAAAFLGLLFTLLSNLSRSGGGPYIGGGGSGGSGGSGGWSGGGGGGGFGSGGGFSSGGGGSFGGGGASGDW
ncbi:hypothetical protein GCM10010975_33420 [Comamonas phosphati]|nr:hypothetical protein GCM10010975_33420 [Comamonas phosphati]